MKRILLYLAGLALASSTLVAQDSRGVIVINGGRDSVAMSSKPATHWVKPVGKPFYSNLTTAYQCSTGETLSDGSPVNTEWTQGNVFKSAKTGTTKKITVAIGFVTGTNAATVTLDKDCKGQPCGKPDGKPALCTGHIKNLPVFGQSCTVTTSFKCVATLTKGHKYWVYAQTLANSWDAWEWNGAGATTRAYVTDDNLPWTVDTSTQGAFSVQ